MNAFEQKEKPTWRHWVNKEGKPMTGRYYNFKSFKVYWVYRWMIAEELDEIGVITPSAMSLSQFNSGQRSDITYTVAKFNCANKYSK